MGKTKITKDRLEPLVTKGLSDKEIASKLDVTPIGIYSARKRLGLERPSQSIAQRRSLTQEQKEFMIGCLLGDGSLRVDKNCINPRFTCEHSAFQKEYAEYKYNFLKGLDPKIRKSIRTDNRTGKTYESYVVRLNANPELLGLYNNLYNPTKEISEESMVHYTPRALAIHYMDDGYLSRSGYYIATDSFSLESIKILQRILKEKYDLETSIHRGNRLYIRSESRDKFTSLISQYVIPSMRYKLHNIRSVT